MDSLLPLITLFVSRVKPIGKETSEMCLHSHLLQTLVPRMQAYQPAGIGRTIYTVFYEASESLQSNIPIAHHVCFAQKCQFRLTDAQEAKQVGLQTQHVRQLGTAAQNR